MEFALNATDLDRFRQDGFLCMRQVFRREDLAEVRGLVEDLYARRVGFKEGALFDVLQPGETEKLRLGQLTNPSNFAPRLRRAEFFRTSQQIARQVLGPQVLCSADFVLMKPPVDGATTPWHQDQAYGKADYSYSQMTFWVPLQDVDEKSGCLQFVPGTHKGAIKPHRSPDNNTSAHSFECCETPVPEQVVTMRLQVGDCSIHDGRVLHGSLPNRSLQTRYAYILVFRTPEPQPAQAEPYAWVLQRRDASAIRHRAWLVRGGFLVVLWRKLCRGEFSSFARARLTISEMRARFRVR